MPEEANIGGIDPILGVEQMLSNVGRQPHGGIDAKFGLEDTFLSK
jgi:hypothetical protein